MAVLSLLLCEVLSSCSKWGLLSSCASYVVASLIGEHRLYGMQASVVVALGLSNCCSWALEHRVSSCGAWAYLLCGMWDLRKSGTEPRSPALAGRFFTTEPPRNLPSNFDFDDKVNVAVIVMPTKISGSNIVTLVHLGHCNKIS